MLHPNIAASLCCYVWLASDCSVDFAFITCLGVQGHEMCLNADLLSNSNSLDVQIVLLEMHCRAISFVKTLFRAHQLCYYFMCGLQWCQLHVKLPSAFLFERLQYNYIWDNGCALTLQIGMLGGYGFQGQVTAGDGSKMGAGYNNLRRKKKKQQCKVGREEEGSSSNRPKLAAFFLALLHTPIEEPLLYLCDNQSLLKAVTRWIGEGGKATLVGAPDIDILAAANEILWKRIAAETATFLVKVKAHRGEPANEGADILATVRIRLPQIRR